MLNSAGMDAQFERSCCAISRGILTQISYCNRHHYACVSFLKVKKKSELPEDYFVLTLGLSAPLESDRVAAKTEPYPGRWTTHFVISSPSDLDEKLFDWIEQAYSFAQEK